MFGHPLIAGGFIVAGVTNVTAAVASIGDHLDLWAPAANTLLLIVLAYVSRQEHKASRQERKAISEKVDSVHESVSHGAAAAASAATAAEASARIVKEIGGAMRSVDVTPLEEKAR